MITITWDGTVIPTVPQSLMTASDGSFTAIISVLTQNETGAHMVEAADEGGNTMQATFTVLDMTGPAGADGADGATGPAGADGADGATGPAGAAGPVELLWASLILAIVAILIAIFTFLKKS